MLKKSLRILKKTMMLIGIVIGVFFIVIILFINLSPQFGGSANSDQLKVYAKSKNFRDGIFINIDNVNTDLTSSDRFKAIKGLFTTNPGTRPEENIDVVKIDSTQLTGYVGNTRLFWFGHSAFLLQLNNKTLLLDPMFGTVAAPSKLLGTARFSKDLPIEVAKLPYIDAVLISHDHYDHLDYGSILKLKDKVGRFYVPLGIGAHLEAWGIPRSKINEMDWWDEYQFEDLKIISTPAQHFSGRSIGDRFNTLWCSWVIKSPNERIFFSGDTGYARHFSEIGKRHGPFDFAMMECGQYNDLWPKSHMLPEETAQAGLDLNAEVIMPIHWAAFKLSSHPWTDPIERVITKANELNLNWISPKIGEPILLENLSNLKTRWWQR